MTDPFPDAASGLGSRVSNLAGEQPEEPPGSGGPAHPSLAHPLSQQAKSGVAWSGLSRVLIQLIQFGSSIALARLLTPSDYGLVAIVASFTGFALLFTDLGLGAAIIHRAKVEESLLAAAFWLNALTGFALTGLFSGLAVPLAHLYGKPALVPLIIIGSLVFSLSLNVVQLALLERSLRFRLVGTIEVSASVMAVTVSISCAASGLGAVSLVFGALTQVAVTTVGMWLAVRWRPRQFVSRAALRELWAFSSHLFGFNVVNYWARNADNLLIGKYASSAVLGVYSRAYNLMMLPVQQVTSVIGRVLFPALSRLRHDQERLGRAYLRALVVMTALGTLLSVVLATSATAFVDVAYGHRWHAAAPLLAVLAASGPAQVVSGTVGALYQALGLTRSQFRRGTINAVVTVAAIVIGLRWGATGVAVALLMKFYVMLPFTVHGCWREIDLGVVYVLKKLAPIAASAGVSVAAGLAVGSALSDQSKVLVLIAQLGAMALGYALCLTAISPMIVAELRQLLRRSPGQGRGYPQ